MLENGVFRKCSYLKLSPCYSLEKCISKERGWYIISCGSPGYYKAAKGEILVNRDSWHKTGGQPVEQDGHGKETRSEGEFGWKKFDNTIVENPCGRYQ